MPLVMIEQLTLFEDGKGMVERCFICASPVLKKGDTCSKECQEAKSIYYFSLDKLKEKEKMIIEEALERIKFLKKKINNTMVLEKAHKYQTEIDEIIDEADRLSIDLLEYENTEED